MGIFEEREFVRFVFSLFLLERRGGKLVKLNEIFLLLGFIVFNVINNLNYIFSY